jgi:hypothetical protein
MIVDDAFALFFLDFGYAKKIVDKTVIKDISSIHSDICIVIFYL